MTPRTRTRRTRRTGARALVVAGTLTVAVGLGACSAVGDPSAAALVDGEVVATQQEVATVARELPPEATGGQPVDPAAVLTVLAFSDPVSETAREFGLTQGAVQAQRTLDELTGVVVPEPGEEPSEDPEGEPGAEPSEETVVAPGEYSDVTLEVIAVSIMGAAIQQDPDAQAALSERLDDLRGRLQVNPRYGEVLPAGAEGLIGPVQHPWLVSPGA